MMMTVTSWSETKGTLTKRVKAALKTSKMIGMPRESPRKKPAIAAVANIKTSGVVSTMVKIGTRAMGAAEYRRGIQYTRSLSCDSRAGRGGELVSSRV